MWVSAAAVLAVGVLAASGAFACTGTQNIPTKIVKPLSKSGPSGTLIKAKAPQSSLMPVGWKFDLLFADSAHLAVDQECHHSGVPIGGPTTSTAGTVANTGKIPGTTGNVPALTPVGQAAVCFARTGNYGALNTLPDFFTVT
ncbi:MAG TPA: hypothetical protein VHM89_03865 [Acidimicrobiales bacterium]|nr:hypothetical protein [Acidimicrobiales bacterium]